MPFVCGWWGWQRPTFQCAHQMVDPGIHIDDPKIPNDFWPTGMIRRIHLWLVLLKHQSLKGAYQDVFLTLHFPRN
jgi:hypothetical protein